MLLQFRKRPALEKKEQEEKGIFNEILLKQTYLPIRLSLIIKDFEEEAQELREVLLIGMGKDYFAVFGYNFLVTITKKRRRRYAALSATWPAVPRAGDRSYVTVRCAAGADRLRHR